MLEDRYYMRRNPYDSRRTATLVLIVINVVAFFAQLATTRFSHFNEMQYLALSVEGLKAGYVWQILTYQFMHASVLHLVFNCWAIYVFGLEVEEALGRARFLTLYFSSGVFGGLLQVLAGVMFPFNYGGPTLGASAAAFGLVAAFSLLFPERIILLFFVIPVRAKYLLLLSGLLALLGILSPPGGGARVADVAHLGGMLTGVFVARYAVHWNWQWPQLRRPLKTPQPLVKVGSMASAPWGRKDVPEEDLPADEFLSKEVDPILDKISAQGIQSLTPRERRVLEAARRKIVKR